MLIMGDHNTDTFNSSIEKSKEYEDPRENVTESNLNSMESQDEDESM